MPLPWSHHYLNQSPSVVQCFKYSIDLILRYTNPEHNMSSVPSASSSNLHSNNCTPSLSANNANLFTAELIRSPFTCPRHPNNIAVASIYPKESKDVKDPLSSTQEISVVIDRTENRVNHVVFLLQIRSTCSLCGLSAWIVAKRYSEFEELHKELARELSAVQHNSPAGHSFFGSKNNDSGLSALPSLPGKKFLTSAFDSEFIQSRRIALEAYINKLVAQPILRQSKLLISFLAVPKPESDALAALFDQYIEMKNTCTLLASKCSSLEQKLKRVEFTAQASLHGAWPATTQDQLLKDVKLLRRKVRLLEEVAQNNGTIHLLYDKGGSETGEGTGAKAGAEAGEAELQAFGRSKSHQSALSKYNFYQLSNTSSDDYHRAFQPITGSGIPLKTPLEEGYAGAAVSQNYHADYSEEEEQLQNAGNSSNKLAKYNRVASQRAAAREQRRSRRNLEEISTSLSDEEKERSLSESHLTDKLAHKHFNYHTAYPNRSILVNQVDKKNSVGTINNQTAFNKNRTISRLAQALKQQQKLYNTSSNSSNNSSEPHSQVNSITLRQHSEPLAISNNSYNTDTSKHSSNNGSNEPSNAGKTKSNMFASFGQTINKSPIIKPSDTALLPPNLSIQNHSNPSYNSSSAPIPTPKPPSLSAAALSNSRIPLTAADGEGSAAAAPQLDGLAGASLERKISLDSESEELAQYNTAVQFDKRDSINSNSSSSHHSHSPITSAMAAISDSVANAVLSGNSPYGTPPALHASAIDNPALLESPTGSPKNSSIGLHATIPSKANKPRRVNRLPPPDLTQATAAAAAEITVTNTNSGKQLQSSRASFSSLANNLLNGIEATNGKELNQNQPNSVEKEANTTVNAQFSASTAPATQSFALSSPPAIDPLEVSLSNDDSLFLTCMDAELVQRCNDLITFIQPTTSSEQRFLQVLAFIEALIRRCLSADTFCHGSFALKTYLPNADLDVSCFFSRSNEEVWVQKLVAALCSEAAQPTGEKNKFSVKSVTFVNAECQVVKCQIGYISVDISANQTGALQTLALFEEMDRLIGQNHLFKRTILLVKTFFQNDLGIVGSHSGFLSAYCIRTFVLFIFNAYHAQIKNPFQALYKLLVYLAQFNWNEHALGIFGPIKLSNLPKFQPACNVPTAWPENCTPLVSPQLLQAYSQVPSSQNLNYSKETKAKNNSNTVQNVSGSVEELSSAGSRNNAAFSPRYMNVIDPTNPSNNLGRPVSSVNGTKISAAFREAASRFATAIKQWKTRAKLTVDDLQRFAAENNTLVEDEELDLVTLQAEEDANLSFRFISHLFEKTLHTYSGRFAFGIRGSRRKKRQQRTAALEILTEEGKLAIPAEELVNGKLPSSVTVSPTQQSAPINPKNSAEVANLASLSDSDVEAETHSPSASDFESDQGGNGKKTPQISGAAGVFVGSEPLDSNLNKILENLHVAKSFEVPSVSEEDLVAMINKLLSQYGSVPVGKLGSLLHNVMNNHSLPSMLKERYGGLKKFIERHLDKFTIGADHQFNPTVHLTCVYQQAEKQAAAILLAAANAAGNPPGFITQPTAAQILAQAQAQQAVNQARLKANQAAILSGQHAANNINNSSNNVNNSNASNNQLNNLSSNSVSPPGIPSHNSIVTSPVRSNPAANASLQYAVGAAEFVPQALRFSHNPSPAANKNNASNNKFNSNNNSNGNNNNNNRANHVNASSRANSNSVANHAVNQASSNPNRGAFASNNVYGGFAYSANNTALSPAAPLDQQQLLQFQQQQILYNRQVSFNQPNSLTRK
jgi:hypothetical protein